MKRAVLLFAFGCFVVHASVGQAQENLIRPLGPEIVEQWIRELETAEQQIQAGQWKKARKTAQSLLGEMTSKIVRGDRVEELFAAASLFRALAEAGLGNHHRAGWDFCLAQTLRPALTQADLSGYGEPGRRLLEWRYEDARDATEVRDSGTLQEESSNDKTGTGTITPPEVVDRVKVAYPYGKNVGCVEAQVIVHFVIDKRGRPSWPKLLHRPDPILGFAALDSVGGWRYRPARLDGRPVPVFYNLTVNFKSPHCTEQRSP